MGTHARNNRGQFPTRLRLGPCAKKPCALPDTQGTRPTARGDGRQGAVVWAHLRRKSRWATA